MRHRAAELGERCRYVARRAVPRRPRRGRRPLRCPADAAAPRWPSCAGRARGRAAPGPRLRDSTREDFTTWAESRGRRRLLLEDFYRDARRRHGVLMDGDEPVGGRWNLDAENREPAPRGRETLGVREPLWPTEDDIDAEVRRRPGPLGAGRRRHVHRCRRPAPVRRDARRGARRARRLRRPNRLARFGPHEDASHGRRPVDGPLPALGAR